MSYPSSYRYGSIGELSKGTTLLSIGVINAIAIAITGVIAWLARGVQLNWIAFIVIIGLALGGAAINGASQNPGSGIVGFAMVTTAYGVLLGPLLVKYHFDAIWHAGLLATLVVAALGAIGAIVIKEDKRAWGPKLMGALVLGIVVMLAIAVFGFFGGPTAALFGILDVLMTLVFIALTIWDFNQAMHDERNFTNIIRYSLGVYLDWMWFFLQILGMSDD